MLDAATLPAWSCQITKDHTSHTWKALPILSLPFWESFWKIKKKKKRASIEHQLAMELEERRKEKD